MDQLLNAIAARLEAQRVAGYIREYHDDEPTGARLWPTAFVASQDVQTLQYTIGQPGKIVLSWTFHLYYGVPLADRRGAFRELARITPLIIDDWYRHGRNTRLGGLARDVQIGKQDRGMFVNTAIAGIDCRALLLPLAIETETLI